MWGPRQGCCPGDVVVTVGAPPRPAVRGQPPACHGWAADNARPRAFLESCLGWVDGQDTGRLCTSTRPARSQWLTNTKAWTPRLNGKQFCGTTHTPGGLGGGSGRGCSCIVAWLLLQHFRSRSLISLLSLRHVDGHWDLTSSWGMGRRRPPPAESINII